MEKFKAVKEELDTQFAEQLVEVSGIASIALTVGCVLYVIEGVVKAVLM